MSDHWIGIIPKDPNLIPPEEAIARAEGYMAELAPEAEEIAGQISETIQFRDCGGNFMSVCCPVCGEELDVEWWRDQMGDEDYWDSGFELHVVRLPCGHETPSLNDLKYDWEQGFSRFILDAMNPNIGCLQQDQIAHFEAILGCPVKVIYQHI